MDVPHQSGPFVTISVTISEPTLAHAITQVQGYIKVHILLLETTHLCKCVGRPHLYCMCSNRL
jgi:hypothetical protein